MATVLLNGERHTVTQCGTCGVWFTVPEIVYECHRTEGGYHSCPNGHSRGWNKGTDAIERENIRRERDRLKQDQARLEQETREAWATANAQSERAQKAEQAVKRLKKRSSAGTCPCCARTFANMAEHMKHQHPGFVADGGAKIVPIKRQQTPGS
jgi:hypothetical protein